MLLWENSNDLCQWFVMLWSVLPMFLCSFANLSVCCRMFSVIDGENSLLSNWIKLQLLLCVNHFKTASVMTNWLNWNLSIISEFIFSADSIFTFPSLFFQKQSPRGVLKKRYSENMQQIYRRTPMPKCDFNKVAKQLYWYRTSAWVFSCKFTTYFYNTFS